jgi:hypothetical protein
MTHVLSISSAQLPKPDLPLFNHCFIDIPNNGREQPTCVSVLVQALGPPFPL